MPKVTIGIPCFNEEKYIAGTLLSAIQQLDEYSDLEIWVGDNKSTDSSVSKIESVLEAIKSAASHVTLIKHEGIKALDNFWYLFDATDSEYFMCLGGHDQISKGYIQQGVTNMTQSLATEWYPVEDPGTFDNQLIRLFVISQVFSEFLKIKTHETLLIDESKIRTVPQYEDS